MLRCRWQACPCSKTACCARLSNDQDKNFCMGTNISVLDVESSTRRKAEIICRARLDASQICFWLWGSRTKLEHCPCVKNHQWQ